MNDTLVRHLADLRNAHYDARSRLLAGVELALRETVHEITPGVSELGVEIYTGDLGDQFARLVSVTGADIELEVLADDEEFDALLDEWATVADPTTTTISLPELAQETS